MSLAPLPSSTVPVSFNQTMLFSPHNWESEYLKRVHVNMMYPSQFCVWDAETERKQISNKFHWIHWWDFTFNLLFQRSAWIWNLLNSQTKTVIWCLVKSSPLSQFVSLQLLLAECSVYAVNLLRQKCSEHNCSVWEESQSEEKDMRFVQAQNHYSLSTHCSKYADPQLYPGL